MENNTKFFFGVAIGAAVGTVAGLLLAPESGEATRKKLIKNAEKLNKSLKENFDQLSDTSKKALKDLNSNIDELKDKAAKKLESYS